MRSLGWLGEEQHFGPNVPVKQKLQAPDGDVTITGIADAKRRHFSRGSNLLEKCA
jgi:hypothetical protein